MGRRYTNQGALQSGATATGNGQILSTDGCEFVTCQVTGITTATITWECTIDGTNWFGLFVTPVNSATPTLTTTADGIVRATCAGLNAVRARISAYTSGTINATAVAMA